MIRVDGEKNWPKCRVMLQENLQRHKPEADFNNKHSARETLKWSL